MIPQYNIDGLGAEYIKTEELERRIAEFLGVKQVNIKNIFPSAIAGEAGNKEYMMWLQK